MMVDAATRALVWRRAASRCEYCRVHQAGWFRGRTKMDTISSGPTQKNCTGYDNSGGASSQRHGSTIGEPQDAETAAQTTREWKTGRTRRDHHCRSRLIMRELAIAIIATRPPATP